MTIKERISELLKALNKGMYERENEVKLALLSSIAGESIFLLGPPGVAKSLVARKLKFAYKDAKVFEYLMNRFSTPDEIFGPVSISKLKNEDKYERIVENYLPNADVVFLDEIWKAGPSIQNALLTVINEKLFRNGAIEIKVPMKALISASNELPTKDQGLEALWDRFLVRLYVDGISEKDNFNKMISEKLNAYEDTADPKNKITAEEYKAWDSEIDGINVPENVFNVIHAIRVFIAEHNKKDENKENQIYISDRRWRKIVRLLRASAFLNGRKDVDLMDCFLIKHCIWNVKEQRNAVSGFVNDAIEKHGYSVSFDFNAIQGELKEFNKEVDTYTHEAKQIKHTEYRIYDLRGNKYIRILNLNGKFNYENNDLIDLASVNNAKTNQFTQTKRYKKDFSDSDSVYIKKGKNKHSLILSNDDYVSTTGYDLPIETINVNKDKVFTKKPHPKVEQDWDERINKLFQHTENMKSQIEIYRTKDLEHLRKNLFVEPALADVVESHITATIKEIEKIEVSIREIQNGYKNLREEEIVIKVPKKKKGEEEEDEQDFDEDSFPSGINFFR
jgi:MoxR-like ATPase